MERCYDEFREGLMYIESIVSDLRQAGAGAGSCGELRDALQGISDAVRNCSAAVDRLESSEGEARKYTLPTGEYDFMAEADEETGP
jgi:hypothetical protein